MSGTAKTLSTGLQQHNQRAHALLSASGASRWINCTPSAKLEEQYGEKTGSVYAAEGTVAHELSELFIRHDALGLADKVFDAELEKLMSHELFNDEMLEMVPVYVDYCLTEFKAAKAKNSGAIMEIEQRLDLTEYVPGSFGTADCVIINDGTLEVIDLKYGKGVPVYAEYNKQGMLYALGALYKYSMLYDITNVKITIVQPRINNISTWEISAEKLTEWAETELKPAAKAAFEGSGELNSGDWCKFCAVKNRCRKLAEKQLEIAQFEFKSPELLTDAEIADILTRTKQLTEWADSVAEYAHKKALEGKIWPGFKLVEGVSRRKWIDDDGAIASAIFSSFPAATEDQIFTSKLKSITEIEKLFGKKAVSEKLSSVILKPQGKPTLVPEQDKRPALGLEDAINDFSN